MGVEDTSCNQARWSILLIIVSAMVVGGCTEGVRGNTHEKPLKRVCGQISERVELCTYYPCIDEDCERYEEYRVKESIAVGGTEHTVAGRELSVSRVLDLGNRVFVLVDNNHSTFLCEVCEGGRLDYLAEASDLLSPDIEGFHVEESPPFLKLVINYSPDTSDEPRVFEREILMANALERCTSLK